MAQQNITTLQSNINTQINDNTSGDISAADVRDNLINMTDSLLFNSGSVSFTGSLFAVSSSFSDQIGSINATSTDSGKIASLILNARGNNSKFKIYHNGDNNAQVSHFGGTLTIQGDTGLLLTTGGEYIIESLPTSEPSTSGALWLSGSAGSNSKILCVRN